MKAKLVVVAGNSTKREVKLRLPVIVGRNRDAGLSIVHPTVSRRHCELFERDGLLMVNDFGSLNGTLVGNTKVTEAIVRPGDQLTIGPLTFMAIYDPPQALVPKRKSDRSSAKLRHNDIVAPETQTTQALSATTHAPLPVEEIQADEVSRVDVSDAAGAAWVPTPSAVPDEQVDPGVYDSGDMFDGMAPPPADLAIDDSPGSGPSTLSAERELYPAAQTDLAQTSSWQPSADWQDGIEDLAAGPIEPPASESPAKPPAVKNVVAPAPVERTPAPYDFPDAISEELDLLFDDGAPTLGALRAADAASDIAVAAPLPTAEPIPQPVDDLDGFLETAVPPPIKPVDLDDFLVDEPAVVESPPAIENVPTTETMSADELLPVAEILPVDDLPAIDDLPAQDVAGAEVSAAETPPPEIELPPISLADEAPGEVSSLLDEPPAADATDLVDLHELAPDDVAPPGELPRLEESPPAAEVAELAALPDEPAPLELSSDEALVSPDAWPAEGGPAEALALPPLAEFDIVALAPEAAEDVPPIVALPDSLTSQPPEALEPPAAALPLRVEEEPSPEFSIANLLDDEPSEVEPAELPDFDDVTPMSDITPVEGSLEASLLAPADEFLPGVLHPELADMTPPEVHRIDDELDSSVLPSFDAGDAERALHSAAPAESAIVPDILPHAAPVEDLDDALFAFDSLDEADAGPPESPLGAIIAGQSPAVDVTANELREDVAAAAEFVIPAHAPAILEPESRRTPEIDALSDLEQAVGRTATDQEQFNGATDDEEFPVPLLDEPSRESDAVIVLPVPPSPAPGESLDDLADEILFAEEPQAEPSASQAELTVNDADNALDDLPDWQPEPEQASTSEMPELPKPVAEIDSWEDVPAPIAPVKPNSPSPAPASSPPPAVAPPTLPVPPGGAAPTDDHRPKARKYVPVQPEASQAAASAGRSWWPFGRKNKMTLAQQEAAALHMAADIRQEKLSHGQPLAAPPPPKRGLLGFLRRKQAEPVVDQMFPPPAQHPEGPWGQLPPQVTAGPGSHAPAAPLSKPASQSKSAPPAKSQPTKAGPVPAQGAALSGDELDALLREKD